MKKIIVISSILVISTLAHSATNSWYGGVGYDGISIKKDISSKYTLQATYGGFGLSGFKGKVLYKFQNHKNYNLYGFAGLMHASSSVSSNASGGGASVKSESESTTKGLEFGVGLELDLKKELKSNIPLFISIELGYRSSTTDVEGTTTANYRGQTGQAKGSASLDHSGVTGGLWIHYKF
jgi:hypothetical protein